MIGRDVTLTKKEKYFDFNNNAKRWRLYEVECLFVLLLLWKLQKIRSLRCKRVKIFLLSFVHFYVFCVNVIGFTISSASWCWCDVTCSMLVLKIDGTYRLLFVTLTLEGKIVTHKRYTRTTLSTHNTTKKISSKNPRNSLIDIEFFLHLSKTISLKSFSPYFFLYLVCPVMMISFI